MAKPTRNSVIKRSDAIHRQYSHHFAGQSRFTRDVDLLDKLIEKATVCAKKAKRLPAKKHGDVQEMTLERLKLYKQERRMILEAQLAGSAPIEVQRFRRRLALAKSLYSRHFAGQNRATRDLGLLDELIEGLDDAVAHLRGLEAEGNEDYVGDRQTLEVQADTYREERNEIARAQATLDTPARADLLAQLANAQFAVYQRHLAGQARVSRRPELLARVVRALESVSQQMRDGEFDALESRADHDANIAIVDERLGAYREELQAIREVREDTPRRELIGSLGAAANDLMATYREHFAGKDRKTRDRELMARLADQMIEIELQMTELDAEHPDDTNAKNLGIVRQQIDLYTEEWTKIGEAQGGGSSASPPSLDGLLRAPSHDKK